MSRDLSIHELASVVGGQSPAAGTRAKTERDAVKNYLSDNGNGSWFSQAGNLGSKLYHRAQYSFGVINYQPYGDSVAAAPGGRNYLADMERLRPSR